MKRYLILLLLLLAIHPANAQTTTFTPVCNGVDDTARFVNLIAAIGANTGTIELPFKNGTRCAVNSLTIPGNITLDNTRGTGLKVNSGQVLTMLGATINPVGRPLFFGPGTVNFTGNGFIGSNGQALVSNGEGGVLFATISGGGGGGLVDSVFGRTGNVVAATGDYTWNQINKTVSDLGDLTIRDASRLSNGTTGTGQVVLHDSPAMINATINGIGFSGVAGRVLTLNNSLTLAAASDGLSGTIPASGTFAMGAATLSVASTSNANTANHSHAIATSSNPGAAAAILASDPSGHLQLVRVGVGIAPSQPLEVNGNVLISAATANLFLKDTSTGLQAATTGVITPQNNNSIRSTDFTLGLVGWGINALGDAEFNNVNVRGEIRSSVFKVNEIAATAGTFGVFFSASNLSDNAVIPASGSFTFNAKNSDAGGMLFAVGDIVRFKGLSTTGVSDTWATITARVNNGSTATYTATLNSGSASTTYVDGTAVVSYGPSGTGFITLSADGTVGSSPNLTMATHAGSPWAALTTRIRAGNLNGSYGYNTDVYGFAAGQYGTAGQSWLTVDPVNGVRIGNNTTVLTQVDAAGNASFTGSVTASSGTIAGWTINSNRLSNSTTHVASGFDIPAGQVAWFGRQTGGSQGWFLRDAAGRSVGAFTNASAPSFPYLAMTDGSFTRFVAGGLNDTFNGGPSVSSMGVKIFDSAGNLLAQFHDLANTIANWTIATDRISAGSGSTTVGMDASVTGGDDVRFFAGSATPSSAPFRVTEAGALVATNASITGAITATSGTFAGSLSAATGTFAGALSAATGTFTGDLTGANMALTGKLTMSGAAAAIAIGTTPPTSASAGTGLWLDRTGIYSLLTNTQNVVLDQVGLRVVLTGTSQNSVFFQHTGGENIMQLTADRNSGTGSRGQLLVQGNSSNATASLLLWTQTASGSHDSFIKSSSLAATSDVRMYSTTSLFGVIIGADAVPASSTALEVRSTTGAFLPPRMSSTQRDALTPTDGMVLYNTTTNKLQVRAAGVWVDLH